MDLETYAVSSQGLMLEQNHDSTYSISQGRKTHNAQLRNSLGVLLKLRIYPWNYQIYQKELKF